MSKLQHEKLNYLEFPSHDLQASKTFFKSTFAWEFTDYGESYIAFTDGVMEGGFYQSPLSSKPEQGAVLVVIYSKNLEETKTKIIANDGLICQDIFDFPGGRRFHFTEPSGNEFAVWSDQ